MSTFTARHYEVVAAKLNEELRLIKSEIDPQVSGHEQAVIDRLIYRFITVFTSDNDGFDRDLFWNAVYKGVK